MKKITAEFTEDELLVIKEALNFLQLSTVYKEMAARTLEKLLEKIPKRWKW